MNMSRGRASFAFSLTLAFLPKTLSMASTTSRLPGTPSREPGLLQDEAQVLRHEGERGVQLPLEVHLTGVGPGGVRWGARRGVGCWGRRPAKASLGFNLFAGRGCAQHLPGDVSPSLEIICERWRAFSKNFLKPGSPRLDRPNAPGRLWEASLGSSHFRKQSFWSNL